MASERCEGGIESEMDMRSPGLARTCRLTFALLFVVSTCRCAYFSKKTIAGACASNLGSTIQNFCVVTPGVLWRGARPDKDSAAWLVQHGARTVVNLEFILDDESAFAQASVTDTKSHELGYFRIRDWEPLRLLAPSIVDDHIAHFLAIVSQQPKPVYVHCRYGMNRTGVMVAAYRILVEGVSDEDAIEEMRRYRGIWYASDERYIRGLSPERREEIRRRVLEWIPKLKQDARIVCESGTCIVSDR